MRTTVTKVLQKCFFNTVFQTVYEQKIDRYLTLIDHSISLITNSPIVN